MKKQICSLLCAAALGLSAEAAVVDFQVDNTSFSVQESTEVRNETLEAAPFVNEQWRTMVPVRAVSEAFGAEVAWDGERQEVKISLDGTELLLYIGSTEALKNGTAVTLDCAPVIVEGRTFVPIRFIGEALDCTVNYAASSRHIVIDDTEVAAQSGDAVFSFAELEALYTMLLKTNEAAAAEMGMDTAVLKSQCLQAALNTALSAVWMENGFPEAVIAPEDLTGIRITAAMENVPFSLEGMRDVLYEKMFISGGAAAVQHLEATTDFQAFYAENYICAKHILTESEETAKEVYEKAVSGEDFDALIATYNTDPGMAQNPDGYVFTTGEMVPEFETAAFAAAEGEITAPVKTDYGFHIIKREALPAYTEAMASKVASTLMNRQLMQVEQPKLMMDTQVLLEKLGISG